MNEPRKSLRLPSSLSPSSAPDSTLDLAELLGPLVEIVARRAAALALKQLHEQQEQEASPVSPSSPYLAGWQAAADYLGLSPSTLKHATGVPRRKIGGAVVFRRDELDAWADAYFEGARRFHNGSRLVGDGSVRGIASARPPVK